MPGKTFIVPPVEVVRDEERLNATLRSLLVTAWREGRDFAVRNVEQQIMDGYPNRPHGAKCAHDVLSGFDCIGCYDEALMTKLTAIRETDPTAELIAAIPELAPREDGPATADAPRDDVNGEQ